MKNYEGFMLETYGKPYHNTNGREVTILGARNGIDENQSQTTNILQQRQFYPPVKNPIFTHKDIFHPVNNGNVNMLASTGGSPLAFALDDVNEIEGRIYSEGKRMHASNPLSAKLALMTHIKQVQDPHFSHMRQLVEGFNHDHSKPAYDAFEYPNYKQSTDDRVDRENHHFCLGQQPDIRSLLPGYESLKNVPVPIIEGQVANTDAINTGNSTYDFTKHVSENGVPPRRPNQSLASYHDDLLAHPNLTSADIFPIIGHNYKGRFPSRNPVKYSLKKSRKHQMQNITALTTVPTQQPTSKPVFTQMGEDAYNEIRRMAVTAGLGAAVNGFRNNYDWRQFFRGEHFDWNEYFNPPNMRQPEDIGRLFMNRQRTLGRMPRVRY